MKNKQLALDELAKDCKIKHHYLDKQGNTCAIGRLAQLSGVPNETLIAADVNPIDDKSNTDCSSMAEAIEKRFGLTAYELKTIQRLNDDATWEEVLTDAERLAQVLEYVKGIPEDKS